MQLVSCQPAFVLNLAFALAVHHRSGDGEAVWPAGAFRDDIIELCDADRSGDVRAFLFQIEVGRAKSAVRIRRSHYPVSSQRFRGRFLRRDESDNETSQ